MNKQKHKEGLLELYNDIIKDENVVPYDRLILRLAIQLLERNISPKKVEQWVVKTEKMFTKF